MSTTPTPLVSIALCTYNGEKHLIAQLETLVNQSYPNLEIIAVDDCSSDNTPLILADYQRRYPYFSVHHNKENLGYVKNFEKAISLCKGDYIALCDQDDIWELNKLEVQLNDIEDHALSYHNSLLVDEAGEPLGKDVSYKLNLYEGKSPYPFLFFNCVSGHSLVFHNRILKHILPFNPAYFHDWWIAIIASEHGGIKLSPGYLVKYRQHATSSTDILQARTTDELAEHFFTPKKLAWIKFFAGRSMQHGAYCENFLGCFDANGQVTNKLKLLFLFLLRYKSILYINKKSNFSKLNFVRKICLQDKYSKG